MFINKKFAGGLHFLEEIIENNKISNYIPTTEIELPIKEKIFKLMAKGTYMVFMRGKPAYPNCNASMKMMQLLRNHYPWVLKNSKQPELNLEYFDISQEEGLQLSLLKYAKFGEIPQLYVDS